MAYNNLLIIFSISLFSEIALATEDQLRSYIPERHFSNRYSQTELMATAALSPKFEIKQSLFVIKQSKNKRKHTARLQLLNMWIDPDITRLFIPRLKDIGKLSLHLHYSLKRSPYLLFDYERVTIKTKVKSSGILQHEAYYNMNIEGAIIGIKVRGKDPLLYFSYRFK
ncbi:MULTISPECIES: hypothetical protein [unclassified Moritella]|uniref:hypothetical protein n=1 Tax=unclassified Moritella TaxID=2637987 RepID=UPI001BAB7029|nr:MULTISPECIES: hypothetical protein [unclassified Moritella]QUM83488.1 hypothetical protein HWV02_02600 [Moritella sp. 28]QUM87793.1 hypothetical protein HWV03_02615 [Moritella sp. 36]